MGDASMLDETQQEVQQVLAVPEAEQALAAAFGQLMTEDMQLLDAPAVSPGGLTVLHEVGFGHCSLVGAEKRCCHPLFLPRSADRRKAHQQTCMCGCAATEVWTYLMHNS